MSEEQPVCFSGVIGVDGNAEYCPRCLRRRHSTSQRQDTALLFIGYTPALRTSIGSRAVRTKRHKRILRPYPRHCSPYSPVHPLRTVLNPADGLATRALSLRAAFHFLCPPAENKHTRAQCNSCQKSRAICVRASCAQTNRCGFVDFLAMVTTP
jgi:hypothetical protein